jgi:glycosyltransferase involved in cell wall biosynthesis
LADIPQASLIIPVFNEEESLPHLIAEVAAVLPKTGLSWEVVLVNDGSRDSSLQVMGGLRKKYPGLGLRIIDLDGNYGPSAAMDAGFHSARGEIWVTMDADLQNDPADIPKLLANLKEYDVAIGSRVKNRRDPWLRRISSRIGNGLRNWATHETIADVACSLKAYKAPYVRRLKLYKGLHRFLPTLLKLEGARVIEVPVNHRPRRYGQAKFGVLNRIAGPLMDLFAVRWMQKRHLGYRMEER